MRAGGDATTRRWISRCCTRSSRSAAGRDAAARASLAEPAGRAGGAARAPTCGRSARARDPGARRQRAARRVRSPRPIRRRARGPARRRRRPTRWSPPGAIRQWRLEDIAAARRRSTGGRWTGLPPTRRRRTRWSTCCCAGGRAAEAAALLEKTLTWAADVSTMFEVWAREKIVAIYADELGQPDKAAEHQRRLVELTPKDVERRVRLADIEMCRAGARRSSKRIDNLLALADLAGDPAVAIALKVEAGRTLLAAPTARAAPPRRDHARRAGDAGRERAGGVRRWKRVLPSAAARAELIGSELAAAETDAPAEAVRALRFRLAHHYEADGRFAEALAALTPLRSEGDPLARAWSYELARRSGDAILEVAILSEETRASDGVLGDEAFVRFAHGEALARAGDPHGAAAAFRRALAAGGDRSGRGRRGAGVGAHRRDATRRRDRPRWPMRCARWRRRAPATRRWRRARCARPRCCVSPRVSPRRRMPPRWRRRRRRRACGRTWRCCGCCPRRSLGEPARDGRGAARDGAARGARLGRLVRRHRAGLEGGLLRARGCARAARRRRRRRGGRAPRLGDRAPAGAGARAVGSTARGGGAWPDGRPDTRRARARRNGRRRSPPPSISRSRWTPNGGARWERRWRSTAASSPPIRSGWKPGRGSGGSRARAAT